MAKYTVGDRMIDALEDRPAWEDVVWVIFAISKRKLYLRSERIDGGFRIVTRSDANLFWKLVTDQDEGGQRD